MDHVITGYGPIVITPYEESVWVAGRELKVATTRIEFDEDWLEPFVEKRVERRTAELLETFKKDLLEKLAVLNPDVHDALAALLTQKRLGG